MGVAVIAQLCDAYYSWWATPARLADKGYSIVRSWFTDSDSQSILQQLCNSSASYFGSGLGLIRCPDGTLSVVARSTSTIALINQNIDAYRQAAAQTDVPWEALAAIHYREASLNNRLSALSGESIGVYNPDNGLTTTSFYDSLVKAGEHLQSKVGGRLTQNTTDSELLKQAFFGYNGLAGAYRSQAARLGFDSQSQGYEGSPYVMSNFDALHSRMGIITHNGGPIDGIDARDGAYTVFALLRGGRYDDTGMVISLGDCVTTTAQSLDSASLQNVINSMKSNGAVNGLSARWSDEYLTTLTVPYWNGSESKTMNISVNKAIASNVQNVFTQLNDIRFKVNPSETHAWRTGQGAGSSRAPSAHLFGFAIDVNPSVNPYYSGGGRRPTGNNSQGVITDEVVDIFAQNGFYWGGNWRSSKDYMHFTVNNGSLSGMLQ